MVKNKSIKFTLKDYESLKKAVHEGQQALQYWRTLGFYFRTVGLMLLGSGLFFAVDYFGYERGYNRALDRAYSFGVGSSMSEIRPSDCYHFLKNNR